jgi:AcrR family transcriptional regulator
MSTSAPATDGASRYHHGDLHRVLLDAALQLIEDQGSAGLTLREAARSVGVSHAAVYRHFADKNALLRAVAVECMLGLRAAMQSSISGTDDPVEAFKAFIVAYVVHAVRHPASFRILFSAEVDSPDGALAEHKAEMMGMLIAGVEACQRAGSFPQGPPERYAVVAWSLAHGLATLLVDGVLRRTSLSANDPLAVADMVTGTVLGALRRARV